MPLTCIFFVVILNYILIVIYNCSLVASISAAIFKVNLDGLSLFFSATYSVKAQQLDVLPVACPTVSNHLREHAALSMPCGLDNFSRLATGLLVEGIGPPLYQLLC